MNTIQVRIAFDCFAEFKHECVFSLGYKVDEFAPIIVLLNTLLHRKPRETLNTVRNKYSHKIFHQVTAIPLLDIHKLLEQFPATSKMLGAMNLTYASIIAACSSTPQSVNTEPMAAKPAAVSGIPKQAADTQH